MNAGETYKQIPIQSQHIDDAGHAGSDGKKTKEKPADGHENEESQSAWERQK